MKGLLTSKVGVIAACLFAVVMAIVVQRVLSRQAARRTAQVPVAPVASPSTPAPAVGTPPPSASRAAAVQPGSGGATPAQERASRAGVPSSTQRELVFLDRYQKVGSGSRIDRDRQGRTITRRRTAGPVASARSAARSGNSDMHRVVLRMGGAVKSRTGRAGEAGKSAPSPDSAVPAGSGEIPAPVEQPDFVPYGHPLKCELVFTIDSTLDESPVVALVVEPVYNNGRLVIPAGTELHGVARPDRLRDRLFSGQDWVLVFPRADGRENGRALSVKGLALDRAEPDGNGLTWGITDGSLGLQGTVIRTMEWDEVKRFAATFVSAAALGLQERETARGVSRAASTPRNAALQGIATSLEEVARKIADEVGRNGVFLRVPGGKQFYFYPQQAIVPGAATAPDRMRMPAASVKSLRSS